MQNGQDLRQILLRPLMKFGGKVQKIFWTQPFILDQILYRFISFFNKIFCSAQVLQLPTILKHGVDFQIYICWDYVPK